MHVKARFVCTAANTIFTHSYRDKETGEYCNAADPNARPVNTQQVCLKPIWTGHPEDNNFSQATPDGELHLTVTNEHIHGTFKPGEVYDLDIRPHHKQEGHETDH